MITETDRKQAFDKYGMNTERILIQNARLVFTDAIEENGFILCENGVIKQVGKGNCRISEADVVLDAEGNYVSSGFIDLHTHGAGGYDFMDNTVEAYLRVAETHARYGTTALLPTTVTCPTEELFRTFEVYKEAKAKNMNGAAFLGLHLEGPYFAYNQKGAQDPEYLKTPDPKEYNAILAASNDIVRWSIAPELDGALELASVLRKRNILVSLGHTDAIYEDVMKAYKAGFTHVTHFYSAMLGVTRKNAYRYAGAVEAAYMIDDMTVEIIADGIHLPKALLQFICRFKGVDKIALCTDSMRAAGMPDGEYLLGGQEKGRMIIVEDNVAKLPDRSAFAGSVATADRLIRTMVKMAGVSLPDAVRMMTLNPARILGIEATKGSLAPGKDADLVVFDKDLSVKKTLIKGKIIHT
ncbi:MAG: N-acetylglucosamine-6-phosphate deacetylase [Tannerella sp.]|jgi:N-acetylglucosamine-6-phosphate deacetylase|nr:N-acetylglucosamine-6-phosphate deacetylase [Tannerella sp.]